MLIKNHRKGKFSKKIVCLASMIGLGILYLFGKSMNNQNIENTASVKIESLLTLQTLEKYNTFLAQSGSTNRLTEEDLVKIEAINETNNQMVAIQINEFEINEVNTENYNVCENDNGELELGFVDSRFKGNYFESIYEQELDGTENRKVISSLGAFIKEQGISQRGYTNAFPKWDESKVSYVIENYGEDVLDCFQEYGFPIPLYDVNDFYEVYEQTKGVAR